MADRCCKTCKHLKVEPDKSGRRVVRAANAYICTFRPPMPLMPDSITKAYGFHWPPDHRFMQGNEGRECQTWEPRNG